jgi:sugar-specific transcriptional regulator TrmB
MINLIMFKDELIKLGLSEGEAKIYDFLLSFGDATASEIANKTKLGRTNVYEYARSLQNRGLVSEFEKKSKIVFHPEHPSELKNIANQKLQQIRDTVDSLATSLGDVVAKYDATFNSVKSLKYSGAKGIETFWKNLVNDSINSTVFYLVPSLEQIAIIPPKINHMLLANNVIFFYIYNTGDKQHIGNTPKQLLITKNIQISKAKMDISQPIIIYGDSLVEGCFDHLNFNVVVTSNLSTTKMFKKLLSSIIATQ